MSSVNRTFLMGNLGSDPDLRYTPGGTAVCTLRMATNEYYRDKAGKDQQRTEWHRVVVWGKPAEACGKVLEKGRLIHVEGRLQTRTWKDKEGRNHYTTEIVASRVQFLPSGQGAQKVVQVAQAEEVPLPIEEEVPAETQKVEELDVRNVTF